MKKSEFNKEIPRYCKNCAHGKAISFTEEIICKKHGICDQLGSCRSYKYDPLKRTPEMVIIKEKFDDSDFMI